MKKCPKLSWKKKYTGLGDLEDTIRMRIIIITNVWLITTFLKKPLSELRCINTNYFFAEIETEEKLYAERV